MNNETEEIQSDQKAIEWMSVKRYSGIGNRNHFNKYLNKLIYYPRVYEKGTIGGVREAYDWEIPGR